MGELFRGLYAPLLLTISLALSLSACANEMATTTCGGRPGVKVASDAETKYVKAAEMMAKRETLKRPQQLEVIKLLQEADAAGCPRATVMLATLKIEQLASLEVCSYEGSGCAAEKRAAMTVQHESVADEISVLLRKSVQAGEGEYEYGLFLLTQSSRHYSAAEGRKYIELAAANDDERAAAFLHEAFLEGKDGFPRDDEKASYWRKRMGKQN